MEGTITDPEVILEALWSQRISVSLPFSLCSYHLEHRHPATLTMVLQYLHGELVTS